MTPEEWRQIREQLNAVLECEPALRSAHLQELVGSYPWLRQEIESLLSTYGQMASDFLEPPKLQSIEGDETSELLYESFIGRRLGPYKIIGQIGAGGMGEVFRASRADDLYEMDVAIKLIRSGQDSESVVTRFKHERQILASLSHTNIARLLDGGTTEEGLPYFVMELIDGQPINEYCNYYALAVNERLKLFLDVCSALSFAHQHRIVHRDIKPSNVLVTASGVPKLLDFGIAKILTPDNLDPKLDNTVTVLRILTPAYASPEQVKGEAITARSDVYSLGVVLYELLTGSSPYVSPGTTPHEIARAVCEEQPKKPSMALSETDSSQKKTPMLTKGEVN